MITSISRANEEIKSIIGIQQYVSRKQYKKSIYVLEKEVPEGTLYYNLFTREVVIVSGDEEIPGLVHKWFYVPVDVDEKSIVYAFWQRYYTRHPRRQKSLSLATILTTTQCNARCPYCYERGTSQNRMSAETAEKAADYIIRNARGNVRIKWFGGEPLTNTEAMDIISKRLLDSDLEYGSKIVSNGYLFDTVSDDTILNLWKLTSAQITVDGTKEQYESIKGLPPGAFERVTEMIERLANLGISVMVRTHITPDNADDIKSLVRYFDSRYTGDCRNHIKMYATPLFETDENPATEAEREKIYDSMIEVENLLAETGTGRRFKVPGIKDHRCMVDSGSSVVIAPTGALTPCEHYHDTEIIGNLVDGTMPIIPQRWLERQPEVSECHECFYYPQCIKLSMCHGDTSCNNQNRRYMKYKVERTMMRVYEQYKATGKVGNQPEPRRGGVSRVRGNRDRPKRNRDERRK